MAHVTYKIVKHDSGWAYTMDGTFSEPFPSHDAALKAAKRAAQEQRTASGPSVRLRREGRLARLTR